MRRADVAIVGGGFSGVALALRLLEAGEHAPKVAVIDRSGKFGTGLAYSTPHPAHLLNVRAARMSACADKPTEFADWLANTRGQDAPHEWFAPRAAYGAYLDERLRKALDGASKAAPTLVSEQVVGCEADGDGAVLRFANGEALPARVVVLAWGNLPSRAPAPFDSGDWDAVVQHNPWDPDAIAAIDPAQDVLLIGTGLTMVDIVLSLSQAPRKGRIFALSQRGVMPRPHSEAPRGTLEPLLLSPVLSEALHKLRREARAAQARGEPWQWTDGPATSACADALAHARKRRAAALPAPCTALVGHAPPPHRPARQCTPRSAARERRAHGAGGKTGARQARNRRRQRGLATARRAQGGDA